jgi:hypothetical protein
MDFAQIFGGMPGKGYQSTPSYFGQKPAGTYRVKKTSGAGRDGLRVSYSKAPYYKSGEQDPKYAEMAKQQQAYQQQLQATAAKTQADVAKQLKIVQSEKSAVSKMTQEYIAMLQKEADAKAKAEEEARVSAATSAANQARQGQTANLQIQPASSTPKTAGTQTFKKRSIASNRKQQLTSGINLGTSSLLNI